jgi:hypothetical protein
MDRQDGFLMVQLAQWFTAAQLHDAWQVVWADDFDPETASIQNSDVQRLLGWGEMLGTLTKHGLMDTELVLDWQWVAGLWSRVGPAARRLREQRGNQTLYENFEALAIQQGD